MAQEQLDRKLLERQALETGICPVREDLYAQAFGTYSSLREVQCTRHYARLTCVLGMFPSRISLAAAPHILTPITKYNQKLCPGT